MRKQAQGDWVTCTRSWGQEATEQGFVSNLTPKLASFHHVAWEAQRDPHILTKQEVSSVTSPISLAEITVLLHVGWWSVPACLGQSPLYAFFPSSITNVPLLLSESLPNKFCGHLIICQLCHNCALARTDGKNSSSSSKIACCCGS